MVEEVGSQGAMMEPAMFSFVIPAYNEEGRLPGSLAKLKAWLEQRAEPNEVIVVDDGSLDGTVAVVQRWMRDWPALRLVNGPHQGKGGAVRAGIFAAQGRYVALADADFSMPVEEFGRFDERLLGPFDLAIGSREAPGAKRYGEPAYRHLMGRVFNAFVQMTLPSLRGIQDTQCGFKVLRRSAAVAICQQQTINGWGFDPEMLVIARNHGYTIRELGVPWWYVKGSRINPIRDTLTMAQDTLRIRRNLRQGRYTPPRQVASASAPLPDYIQPRSGQGV